MSRGAWATGVVVAVVVGAVAGAAGLAVGSARTPQGLGAASAPTSFPIVLGSFDDARQVTVDPTAGGASTVAAGRGGTLTASSCRPGSSVASGTAPWSVDGALILALATSEPLYRDLGVGSHGSDVEALQRELVRLGRDVAVDGRYGSQTGQAVWALRVANGLTKGTGLPLADVVWLPAASATMTQCAPLGSKVSPGDALGQVGASLVAARVSPLPGDLVAGARTLTVGDVTVPVDEKGTVGQDDLAALSALPETGVALQTLGQASPVTLHGVLALADPLRTATVPASAVITDGSATCVAAGGSTTVVQVVSSQLGQSVVFFGQATPPSAVDVTPDASLTCG